MSAIECDNPDRFAALLLTYLEQRGGEFSISPKGHLRADLDTIADFDGVPGEMIVEAVLQLAGPIKRILRSRKTLH